MQIINNSIEYYRLEGGECKDLTDHGNSEQFRTEYNFLNHYSEQIARKAGFGDVRFALIDEGHLRTAYAKPDDVDPEREKVQGFRTSRYLSTEEILTEMETHA